MLKLREKNAIVYRDSAYTYKQLLQYSLIYQNHFKSISENFEKVMIFSENNPNYFFAIYGTLRAGAMTVPVDVMSTEKELLYIVNDCKAEIIFVAEDKKDFVVEALKKLDGFTPIVVTAEDIDTSNLETTPVVEMEFGDDDKTVTIIYTSGTTGSPKGVMLSYKNLWANIDGVTNISPIIREDSRLMMILPLHHIFSYAGCMMAPIYIGSTVYISDGISPDAILDTLQRGRITVLIGVPRLFEGFAKGIMGKINSSFAAKTLYKLASLIGSRALSEKIFKSVHSKFGGCIENFVSGGAALPYETGKIFKTLGFEILEGYGMTECAPMISFTRPGEWKIGYCGRLLDGVEVSLGENDELLVKGPNVMQGYYNKEQESAEILRDGWLHTGDKGLLHPKYGIKITGRLKEIIVTPNGKNISPVEIENEITQLSYVIKEIGVFLKDDIIQAIVYPSIEAARINTGSSIYDSVREEIEKYNLSAIQYKRIKSFHIVSEELPKTRLGKIQRFMLEGLVCEQPNRSEVIDDLEGKSETYKALKEFIDGETKKYAKENDHFEIDLALDSLGRVSFISFIEDSFNVHIKERQLDKLSTLAKLTEYVEKNAGTEAISTSKLSWKEMFELNEQSFRLPKSGAINWISTQLSNLFLNSVYRFKTKGTRKGLNGPTIFVGNHSCVFDGLFLTSKLPWKTVSNTLFFAKQKHFDSRFRRFMARHNNIIVMDINSNVRSSMQKMYEVLKSGRNIVIFPEGTRSKDGGLQEFKDGFAILAQALNVSVVPVSIKGGEQAICNRTKKLKMFSKIRVEFLPALRIQAGESIAEFKNKVHSAIAKSLATE